LDIFVVYRKKESFIRCKCRSINARHIYIRKGYSYRVYTTQVTVSKRKLTETAMKFMWISKGYTMYTQFIDNDLMRHYKHIFNTINKQKNNTNDDGGITTYIRDPSHFDGKKICINIDVNLADLWRYYTLIMMSLAGWRIVYSYMIESIEYINVILPGENEIIIHKLDKLRGFY
jgi:hypothetical protein